jgi:hypothetical protein
MVLSIYDCTFAKGPSDALPHAILAPRPIFPRLTSALPSPKPLLRQSGRRMQIITMTKKAPTQEEIDAAKKAAETAGLPTPPEALGLIPAVASCMFDEVLEYLANKGLGREAENLKITREKTGASLKLSSGTCACANMANSGAVRSFQYTDVNGQPCWTFFGDPGDKGVCSRMACIVDASCEAAVAQAACYFFTDE